MTKEQQWQALREYEGRLLATVTTPIMAHDITLNGQTLHYLTAGNEKLPPLVMVHGRGGASALWYPIIPLLAPHRRIIAIDMPGWGLSQRVPFTGTTPQAALSWWRDGVLSVIDALEVQRFDLLGHSLGGFVSLAIALERGTVIDHLVLEDAAGLTTHFSAFYRVYFRVSPERLAHIAPRSLVERVGIEAPANTPAAQRSALNDFVYALATLSDNQSSGVRAFNRIYNLSGVHLSLQDRVSQLVPLTRAIWGADDALIPLRYTRPTLERIPEADIVTIPGAAHSPHVAAPQAFTLRVLEHLARGHEVPVTTSETS